MRAAPPCGEVFAGTARTAVGNTAGGAGTGFPGARLAGSLCHDIYVRQTCRVLVQLDVDE